MSKKGFYIGFGCLNAEKIGDKLRIPCWRVTTTNIRSSLYVSQISGDVKITPEKEIPCDQEGCKEQEWAATLSPNSCVLIEVQNQYNVTLFWNGSEHRIISESQIM